MASAQDDAEKQEALRQERIDRFLRRAAQGAQIVAGLIGAAAGIKGLRKAK
jgi:hypothetical protein